MTTDKDKPTTTTKTPERQPPAFVKSREAMTRNMSMRDADIRQQLRMAFSDPLHIPPELIPEDMEYHWGRDTYRNEPDPARLMVLEQRGWTTVPADRHPQLARKRQDERDKHLDGYVHFKGLILMERPKRWGDIEREMEAEACYDAMVGLPVNDVLESGETRRMGIRAKAFQNQTSVQKMASFKE